jgi:glycosyltransferase involved in cell wall biosynthesis
MPGNQLSENAAHGCLISVVVPVYRSESTLPELHRRLCDVLSSLCESYELILVEDCGGDRSWDVIESLAAKHSNVRGIRLSRNFGQHAATICGFSYARGEWIVTLDDDLEHEPEAIPQLFSKAREGFDLVYGVYPVRTHRPWRNVTSALAKWLFKKAIPSLNDEYTSFRIVRGDIGRALTQFDSPFPFVDGYLSWITNRYSTVQVAHGKRAVGESSYTIRKLVTHTTNIFVTFSDLPLRFASWVGVVCFVVGMGWLGTIVIGRLLGVISVSGFASIMAAVTLFGGIQVLILGIMGEYLARMNFKSSRKPLFLASKVVGTQQVGTIRPTGSAI